MESRIRELLETDLLRHIVALKTLSAYPSHVKTGLVCDERGWALLTILPTSASPFDRNEYPDSNYVVTVDGNDPVKKKALLERLPEGQGVSEVDRIQ